MYILNIIYSALLAASGVEALRSAPKVKLSKIQSLTLRKDQQTSHRRVEAIPQLRCVGGSGRGFYDVDVMRCKNSGSDYDEDNIQWTCTASLPEEFKLGSTDVICEGYDFPEDPYILKGSCGVEYKLILTDKGREKYGSGKGGWHGGNDGNDYGGPKTMGERIAGGLFWMLFIGVLGWMIYSAYINREQRPADGVGGGNRPGWGGGGGGWGGGYNDDNNNDPPPPYYPSNPGKQQPGYGATQGWRPGFWSGAAGGAAAGWAAGRMGNNRGNQTGSGWGAGSSSDSCWNNGEGSSRSSSGGSFSGTRHESTGFGSTSRR